ncbi:MAG: RnfABCDGE type electron transport complex subunit B [Deltaproteobacteria bacterium]|jgi:electron transport complex protein RnfB|nr:RnfABCDGE type electron transport complex subunit B [Deltaproteobacteria bacterium]MCW9049684.1 RnfABCDGE type electron transport complex subunit B [Deltaproteobacteria bacterium]
MLTAILCLGGIGLVASATLGLASKKFAVEVNPREAAILDALPGANCGACGEPGCSGYAKGVAEGRLAPTLCTPGGSSTIQALADILGIEAVATTPQVAVVLCQGDNEKATSKYHYLGLTDCNAAQKLADGPKTCPSGCLGLGSCAVTCPFDAIEMTPQGLAVINHDKCTGCEKCVSICPRNVIKMVPKEATTHVLCNSHDKGAAVRKYCQIGCIGCNICKKTAPEAYLIENFLARVDYEHHQDAAQAIEKCPMKCIRDFSTGYPEGSKLAPPKAVSQKDTAA